MTLCALLVRSRCYDGFHVLCNFGVLRLPANDITLDREQLRKDDQHVLEHHQFHVSVFNFLSLSPSLFFFFFIPRDKAHSTFPPRDFSKFSTRRGDEIHFCPFCPSRVSCKYAYTRVGTRAKRVSKRCSPGRNRFLAASWLLSNDPSASGGAFIAARSRYRVCQNYRGPSLHGCARFNTYVTRNGPTNSRSSRGSFRRRPNRRR